MKIEYISPHKLIPYENNAKLHPPKQVEHIANSIREFGFQQPVVVDKHNVVIIGHGRLLASMQLDLPEIPCVRVENLTDEQIKALRLADNKVAESGWSENLLNLELSEIEGIDMTDFGFDLNLDVGFSNDEEDEDDEGYQFEDDRAPSCQHNVFENQERMQFPITNYWGIPEMEATQTTGDKFLRFCDWKEEEDLSQHIAHFYYDDYKFMSAWREPDKYIERLRQFKAVIAPDFSSYTDFPIVLQVLGAYRRNWCGAYWQYHGIDVIPDVQWGNEETYKWCFDGIPKDATVAISSLGVKRQKDWNGIEDTLFAKGFAEMMDRLHPKTILWYGDKIDGCEGNIIHIPSYYEQKREGLNEQARQKREEGKNGKG